MAEEKTTAPTPKNVPEKVVGEAEKLPKSMVRKLVKDKLSQYSKDGEISVLNEAVEAFSESSRIFIHYLSAAQTISAEDVFKALEDIEFPEFIAPLRASLEDFRQKSAVKKAGSSKAKEVKKSKPTKNGTQEEQTNNECNEDDEEVSAHDNIETSS